MKKHIISLTLVALLTLFMAGCSSDKDAKTNNINTAAVSDTSIVGDSQEVSNNPTISPNNSTLPTETETPQETPQVKIAEVITPQYPYADNFYDGLAVVEATGSKYGFIDKAGKEIIPFQYSYARPFSEGYAAVDYVIDSSDSWTFIDKTGKEITSSRYEDVESFSDGMAAVSKDFDWGYINTSGEEVIPIQYDDISSFSDGVAVVRLINDNSSLAYRWNCAVIDKTGKKIVPTGKYSYIDNYSEGLAAVIIVDENSKQIGFIDKTGKEVIPLSSKYDNVQPFTDGIALVSTWNSAKSETKWGAIDKNGKEVVSPKYDTIDPFSEGVAVAKRDGEMYIIDSTGKELINAKYDAIGSFTDGVAIAASVDGGFCVIDKMGNEIVPGNKYSTIYNFNEGYAVVVGHENFAKSVIDTTGAEVVPLGKYQITGSPLSRGSNQHDNFNYVDGWAVSDGMILIRENNQYGYIAITK